MVVYEREVNSSNQTITFTVEEKMIYGSSRLGVLNDSLPMLGSQNSTYTQSLWSHVIGKRTYELSNHLGNVLSVISDKPIPHNNGSGTADYFMADIRQAQDYSPFGVTLQGRNFSISGADGFRFGFQGQEMDDEIKGEGNSVNYKYRMHDPRIGRFFAIDPLAKKYPHYTPYSFSGNKLINAIELEGAEELVVSNLVNSGIPALYVYTESSLQNQVMFVLATAVAGVVNTIERPATVNELVNHARELNRQGPVPSRTRAADTQKKTVFRDANGQFINLNLALGLTGTPPNPVMDPANTTSTSIINDFGATPAVGGAVNAVQTINFQIANGANALNINYSDGGNNLNNFVFTDAATGNVLSPAGGYNGTGAVVLAIPAGVTSVNVTVTGVPNQLFDTWSVNVSSSGPTAAAANIPAVNINPNGGAGLTMTTTPIVVTNGVTSTFTAPINQ